MENTFFEHLGMASMEKVHSQTIAWIFSNHCEAYNAKEKTQIIDAVFGISGFMVQRTITEYDKIDIVIYGEDDRAIVIENKLKSSEHGKQLEEAEAKFPDQYYFFLTLVGETASRDNWQNVTYDKLVQCLPIFKDPSHAHQFIVNEYLLSIQNLVHVKNEFLKAPQNFSNVFTDGALKKSEKFERVLKGTCPLEDSDQRYIFDNQLETIFQKLFFLELKKHIKETDLYIIETRGTAIFGKWFRKCNIQGVDYNFGFDFQNGSFKLYVDPLQKATEETDPILFEWFTQLSQNSNGVFNKPHTGTKKKKYIAISYRLSEGSDFYKLGVEKLAELFTNGLEETRRLITQNPTFTTLIKNPA